MSRVIVRFIDELNDFLPTAARGHEKEVAFKGKRSVKDLIESLGVPHVEIDRILVGGKPAGFTCPVQDGDSVLVFPFPQERTSEDCPPLSPLHGALPRFVCDVHLGVLCRRLRLLGFDTLYDRNWSDIRLSRLSAEQERILLSRDRQLLKRNEVRRGLYIRSQQAGEQLRAVLTRLNISRDCRPFSRCLKCNGNLCDTEADEIVTAGSAGRIPPRILRRFRRYRVCSACGSYFWKGSHYEKLKRLIEECGIAECT